MRIGSHYRSRAFRFLPALLALVYIGALSGGFVLHMEEEATELRDAAAAAESRSGDPIPPGHDVPDDLDCLLCQVLGSPGHPGADPASEALAASGDALSPSDALPLRAGLRLPGNARAPPST